jgi:hypothetical protein
VITGPGGGRRDGREDECVACCIGESSELLRELRCCARTLWECGCLVSLGISDVVKRWSDGVARRMHTVPERADQWAVDMYWVGLSSLVACTQWSVLGD